MVGEDEDEQLQMIVKERLRRAQGKGRVEVEKDIVAADRVDEEEAAVEGRIGHDRLGAALTTQQVKV